jgi:hypothetical protein
MDKITRSLGAFTMIKNRGAWEVRHTRQDLEDWRSANKTGLAEAIASGEK